MKVIRQVGEYSLIKNTAHSISLCYYIDNGEDVSEYQDEFDIEHLKFVKDDDEFVMECKKFMEIT
jgi:hypothetical protein